MSLRNPYYIVVELANSLHQNDRRRNATTGNAMQNPKLYDTSSSGALDGEYSEEAISPWVANNTDLSALARNIPAWMGSAS